MKIRTMDRNNLKDPRQEAFKYNAISLPFFGFFINETTLSWQIKNIFSTTSNVKYYRKTEPILNHAWLIPRWLYKNVSKRNSVRKRCQAIDNSAKICTLCWDSFLF